jgi:hypothetical protein
LGTTLAPIKIILGLSMRYESGSDRQSAGHISNEDINGPLPSPLFSLTSVSARIQSDTHAFPQRAAARTPLITHHHTHAAKSLKTHAVRN